jgi:methionyl-tRNA formyltransferase
VRVVFFGSPSFALPTLEALLAAGHEVPLVVSQPGKPAGRESRMTDPPVAARAKSLGMHVFQPSRLKDDAAFARLAEVDADAFVVAAYGKILAPRTLGLPRLGCLNVHASLLPRWRGASPVQAALLAGDAVTGISIMRMEEGMDTGPVYTMREMPIEEQDDSASLSERLAILGADALIETLNFLEGEGAQPVPQDPSLATYCPKIAREDGRVDWTRPAAELVRRSRAFTPWPGLFTLRRNTRLKLAGVSLVASGDGAVAIATLQAEGRRPLAAAEFVRGERISAGETWGG